MLQPGCGLSPVDGSAASAWRRLDRLPELPGFAELRCARDHLLGLQLNRPSGRAMADGSRSLGEDMSMSVEIIRYCIPAGQEGAFEKAYGEAQRYLADSPVCRSYELLRCEEEPARYLLRIEWTSTADHLGGFRRSAAFPSFLALVRPFIGAVEEMQHYRPTAVVGQGGVVPAVDELRAVAES